MNQSNRNTNTMKKYLFALIASLFLIGCASQYPDLEPGLYADIQTNKGSIVVALAYNKTPNTVANFVSLSEGKNPRVSEEYKDKKYYDGIIFHRVISDFMIQGGDPLGTGAGGPGYKFDDEITDLTHSGPGILSMANAGPGSNGSQFFITHKATPWLDGKHTVFGRVIEGQNVVDSIAQNDTIQTVKIIRKGREAKNFNAPEIFETYFTNLEKLKAEANERKALILLETQDKFEAQKAESKTTASGLQYIITKKGEGPAVTTTNKVVTHYAVYFEDGRILETSKLEIAEAQDVVNLQRKAANAYQPLTADVSENAQMIEGFKEGLRMLNVGDEATFFLPYTLAYGDRGRQGIPPKSNLIFEIQVVDLAE